MFKRLLAIICISAFLAAGTSSCVVRPYGHHRHALKAKKCKPGHYWDGHKCRHKGKGHGARKHDY